MDIQLGFATLRIYDKDGEPFFNMWPPLGTQMTMPLIGSVSSTRIIRNTADEFVLAKGLGRYTFRFSPREAGPDALRYSVSICGVIPIGTHWGDISSDGKRALLALYRHSGE